MSKVLATLLDNFSPLRNLNFRIYMGGQLISLIGTWLQATAQGWLVWELTGSEAALGVVTMLNTLPLLLLGPWAGVWADRLDRRKLLIWTQVGAMVLAFMLAFLVQTDQVQLWHVFLLALGLGVVNAIDLPTQQAFLGDLTGMGEVRKAINLNGTVLQGSRVMGPVFAGFLIARIGNAPAFWINGISFLAVIVSLVMVRASQTRRASSDAKPLAQIAEAFRFWRTQPRLQDLFFFMLLNTFCYWSIVLNLLPAIASKVLSGDASTLGILQAASGAGAVTGLLIVVPLSTQARRSGLVLVAASLWIGIWLFAFSLTNVVAVSFITLFLATLGAPVIFTMAIGLTQVMSPPDMRARLISLFTMVGFGMQPLAALFAGLLAERIGTQPVIQINAAIIIVGAIAILLARADLRRWITVPPTVTGTVPVVAVPEMGAD